MTERKDHDSRTPDPQSLIEAWREYGKRFTVFVPEYQPVPVTWESVIPEYDAKGKTNPQYLKHWKFLQRTKEFLREHYAKHRILRGPTLYFDCLVPKFQDRMRYNWLLDEFDLPTAIEVNDNYAWYDKTIRMGLFGGEVGFSCRSVFCERHWCRLHRGHPHRLNPADIYGLVSTFENISLASAKTHVGKWWGVKLGDLKGKGTQESVRSRYKVSKKAIHWVLKQYGNMRVQHVVSLIRVLRELIQSSPHVNWHQRMFDDEHTFFSRKVVLNLFRINGPAVKAYVWLLMRQEELARNTRGPRLLVSDADLARALGVSRETAGSYRQRLTKLRLVETAVKMIGKKKEIRLAKVKY